MSLIKLLLAIAFIAALCWGMKRLTARMEKRNAAMQEALDRFWNASGRIETRIDDVPMSVLDALVVLASTFHDKGDRQAFAMNLDGQGTAADPDISEITLEDYADFEAAVFAMTDALAARFPRRWGARVAQVRTSTPAAVRAALLLSQRRESRHEG